MVRRPVTNRAAVSRRVAVLLADCLHPDHNLLTPEHLDGLSRKNRLDLAVARDVTFNVPYATQLTDAQREAVIPHLRTVLSRFPEANGRDTTAAVAETRDWYHIGPAHPLRAAQGACLAQPVACFAARLESEGHGRMCRVCVVAFAFLLYVAFVCV